VGAIQEESRRLDQLLKDFQQLARYRRPEFAEIDPVEPLERALRLALAAREDIRVERRITHGTARICADPDLLRQAWASLLVNALEAMGGGPGALRVSSQREQGFVVIALEDSGPGIPVEFMPRIFEPFFTTKEQGTGLGLTLANTLVEANGGRLELQPSEGRGARFAMRLPECHTA
jgi:signal transduction histidine kinase